MSVVVETTLGDITIDLFMKQRPRACLNFLKLCKIKYYNYNLFHTISRGFIAQTGDPTGSRNGGESIFSIVEGPLKRYFEAEKNPRIKHTTMGLVSFVGTDDNMIGSQFFITLGNDLTYLDEQHCIFGEVMEGLDVLELLNETICDQDNRPYKDVRITHTVILDDPFPDPENLHIPSRSPSPSVERLQGGRLAPDEDVDETQGKSAHEVNEIVAAKEAKARATILEMIGDIPDAEMAPPENVLFVCKLNPVTTDDDLEIIFSRFGKINSCEVIRDKKTGESLQYAFVEFDENKACEDAYFKMDNVLIDDRRIHVDFSQSVAKVKWHGKGRGVTTYDDKGKRTHDKKNDLGNGRYIKRSDHTKQNQYQSHNKQFRNKRDDQISKGKYEENYNKAQRLKRENDYKYNYHNTKEKLYRQDNKKYLNEKYSRKYDSHQSQDYRRDHKLEQRYDDDKRNYSNRSRSHEESRNSQNYRTKHEGNGKSSITKTKSTKYPDRKKRRHSSSDEDSATEDSTSSTDDSDYERRHKKKNIKKTGTHNKHKKSKKSKKKSKRKSSSSSDSS